MDTATAVMCKGITKAGQPCKSPAIEGSPFCNWHGHDVQFLEEGEVPKTTKLKPYPFRDSGVNENAAIRMIALVIPNCPIDGTPEIRQKDGTYRPNPNFTGELNCQQAYKLNNQGRWDVAKCQSLGHDPYHTSFRQPVLEEVLDDNGYVTDTKVRYKVEKRLNVIQVSDNPRHTNRTEVALALAKGCKRLEEFGYASPCEFRNCSAEQKIDTQFGKYCSERHARLVAADFKRLMLPIGGDPYTEDQAMEERNQMLENLNIRKGG